MSEQEVMQTIKRVLSNQSLVEQASDEAIIFSKTVRGRRNQIITKNSQKSEFELQKETERRMARRITKHNKLVAKFDAIKDVEK